jgi:epoxyqueuosine reductase
MEITIPFEEVREEALRLGWDDVGVTTAVVPEADKEAYHRWLEEGQHGKLLYMENTIRCNPLALLPNAKTALIFVTYYKQEKLPFSPEGGLVASYARGKDYHRLHRKRLKKMIQWLENRSGQKNIARGFSDSAPVLEKALAVQAGLGWFGKNTLLIHRKFGTFTLLSGLFTTLDVTQKVEELRLPRCGSCTRCLDACPTQALISPYHLDAAKCLSYHLIESKEEIPTEIQKKNPGYAFGCDICQDACPHNFRKQTSPHTEFSQESGFGAFLTESKLHEIEQAPEKLYGTPLQRRGVAGLKKTFASLQLEISSSLPEHNAEQ